MAAIINLFDPTGSTSHYDIWCDRALIVTRIQCLLAAPYASVLITDGAFPNTNGYTHKPIPDWEKAVAIIPVCLAAINCPPDWLLPLGLFSFHRDEDQKILVFAISEAIQLLLCTLLTVHDFIRHGNTPTFWLSFVLWLLPAVASFVHGIRGLYAICSYYRPRIELNLYAPHPQYSDVDDDGPLARAFHSQQDMNMGHLSNEEDTLEPDMTASLDDERNGTSHRRRFWQGDATLDMTNSSTRFRWQEVLKNRKGMIFWLPYASATFLAIFTANAGSFTLRHTTYDGPWPEYKRLIMIITAVPACTTCVTNVIGVWALHQPRFTVIFLALCANIIAIVVWTTAFIAVLTTYSAYRPYAMLYCAPYTAICHCCLAYVALKLEWDSNCNSLMKILRPRRN